jgi:hypothetical protein
VREANFYDRFYKALTREFFYVKRDLAKVGMNLGCGSFESDTVSSRFSSLRQASF